jgi:hypothetical protein
MTGKYKNKLIDKLNNHTVFITLRDGSKRPYTTVSKKIEQDGADVVKAWDCLAKKEVALKEDQILGDTVHFIDNKTKSKAAVKKIIDDFNKELKAISIDKEELEKIYFHKDVTPHSFTVLKELQFKIGVDDLHADTLEPDKMEALRELWLDKIREQRNKVFEELDELEKTAKEETPEDVEDVESIKQMFRDIPQDIDLSGFNNVKDLVSFWPALLMPPPDIVSNLKYSPLFEPPTVSPLKKLTNILNEINDKGVLEQLKSEMESSNLKGNPDMIRLSYEKLCARIAQLNS